MVFLIHFKSSITTAQARTFPRFSRSTSLCRKSECITTEDFSPPLMAKCDWKFKENSFDLLIIVWKHSNRKYKVFIRNNVIKSSKLIVRWVQSWNLGNPYHDVNTIVYTLERFYIGDFLRKTFWCAGPNFISHRLEARRHTSYFYHSRLKKDFLITLQIFWREKSFQ